MTATSKSITQKNITNVRLFVLFILLVISNSGVFGQNKIEVSTITNSSGVSFSKKPTIIISSENNIASISMDFAVWFIGTKNTSSNNKSNGGFSNKQLINSGINTNSVLIKSIMKKISYQGNGVA
jgi:hypothetical protein